MGLTITLSIHQVEDVVFDDPQALNQELMSGSMGELYQEIQQGTPGYQNRYTGKNDVFGPILNIQADQPLEIANVEDSSSFGGYNQYTEVWGCWDRSAAQTIADHMTSGKLVFLQEIEGNSNVYWVITPGRVEEKSAGALTF